MDRNLALEFVRATEAAALAAARWMGKGNAVSADQGAAEAMCKTLNDIQFTGTVVVGDSNSGSTELLKIGEQVGSSNQYDCELAVDALECTRSVAFGRSNAMSVVATANQEGFFRPPVQYMEKLAVGPDAAGVIDLNRSVEENLTSIARVKGYALSDLTVVVLDRERHTGLIQSIRQTGARIHLIPDGDVSAAIATATPGSGIDVLMGIGNSTAGVLAAAALRCIGGELLARLAPMDQSETVQLREMGYADLKKVYRTADLARGSNVMFAATGVTDGDVLNGVCYRGDGATTHSMVMRSKSRTRRFIVTEHYFDESPVY